MKYQHSEEDIPIIGFIAKIINDHLDEWYGDQSGFAIMTPSIRCYYNCFMIRFPLYGQGGIQKNILVKIRRHPKMKSLNQAILKKELHTKIPAEFNELESLYNFLGTHNANLGAIRPLIYLEQYYAIVMEEFESQTLRQILMEWKTLLNFKSNRDYLLNAAELTGQWLNNFHSKMHKYREVEGPSQLITAEVQELINRLKTTSQQHELAKSIGSEFLQKITSIQSRNIPFTNIHGDMTCDNALYSKENKVCMIDIKTRIAPIYSDIGLIMIHPDTFMPQIFSFGLFFRKRIIRAYRTAILRGYFGDQKFDSALVNLYCAIKMLDKWVMYENIMSKAKGGKYLLSIPAAPLLRAYFRLKIRKYFDSIHTEAESM